MIKVTSFAKAILEEFSINYNKELNMEENEILIASEAISDYVKKHDYRIYRKIQSERLFKVIQEDLKKEN